MPHLEHQVTDPRDLPGASLCVSRSDFAPLRLSHLELDWQVLDHAPLLGFCGPTLRGFLGTALHEAARDASGRICLEGSLFQELFEGGTAPGGRTSPFVLHAPGQWMHGVEAGTRLSFALTVVGDIVQQTPILVRALALHGLTRGITRRGSRLLLLQGRAHTPVGPVTIFDAARNDPVESWMPDWTWPADALLAEQALARQTHDLPVTGSRPVVGKRTLRVELLTPLDLREQGRPVKVLEFLTLVRSLLRNAGAHLREHAGQPLRLEFDSLFEMASRVRRVEDHTRFARVLHFSHRQRRWIPIQAHIGSLHYEGDFEPFLPLLELGRVLHVGKGRTMGFGGMAFDRLG